MDCQKIRYYKKCLYDIYDTERCIHANFHISFPSKYFLRGFKKDLSLIVLVLRYAIYSCILSYLYLYLLFIVAFDIAF